MIIKDVKIKQCRILELIIKTVTPFADKNSETQNREGTHTSSPSS